LADGKIACVRDHIGDRYVAWRRGHFSNELEIKRDTDRERGRAILREEPVVVPSPIPNTVTKSVYRKRRDNNQVDVARPRLERLGRRLAKTEPTLFEARFLVDEAHGHHARIGIDRRVRNALSRCPCFGSERAQIDLVTALDRPKKRYRSRFAPCGQPRKPRTDTCRASFNGRRRHRAAYAAHSLPKLALYSEPERKLLIGTRCHS
jgi:hypothetical protein